MSNQYPRQSTCSKPIKSTPEDSLATLVKEYWNEYKRAYDQEDQWWTEPDTWEGVLERAWRSKMRDGKIHGHQRRVATHLSEGLKFALSDNKSPEEFPNFDSLYQWTRSVGLRVIWYRSNGAKCRLKEVTAYDIARRIGAKYGLIPTKVYLHGGTEKGAKKLGIRGEAVTRDQFPDAIRNSPLDEAHIENFLCTQKDKLG